MQLAINAAFNYIMLETLVCVKSLLLLPPLPEELAADMATHGRRKRFLPAERALPPGALP